VKRFWVFAAISTFLRRMETTKEHQVTQSDTKIHSTADLADGPDVLEG
jgi:hypothetical protein